MRNFEFICDLHLRPNETTTAMIVWRGDIYISTSFGRIFRLRGKDLEEFHP